MKHYIVQFTLWDEPGNISLYKSQSEDIGILLRELDKIKTSIVDNITDEIECNYIEITKEIYDDLEKSVSRIVHI